MTNQWPDANDRSVQGIEKAVTWFALAVLLFLYWGYVWFFEQISYSTSPPGWWISVISRYPLFEVVEAFVLVPLSFFSFRVLRHFIPVLVAAWFARHAVHRFLTSFYGLPGDKDGRTLLKRLRAWRVPTSPAVTIDGEALKEKRDTDPVITVGGPAKVVVERSSAVATEVNGRFGRVLGPGTHFLARFERPFQIVDLRPQDRQTDEAKMMTKDGIDVVASVGVTFHIDSGDQTPSPETPYPFDARSVRKAAYTQTVAASGKVGGWKDASLGAAVGALAEIVGESRLDELAHPMQGGIQPYPSRNREMRRATRSKMAKQGVTVTDTRLGRLELPDAVLEKYLEYWRVYEEKKRRLEEVEGQAALLEETQIARARASALMFQAILEGLQRAKRMDKDASSKRIVAIRLIETLQAMARRSQDVSPLPDQLMVSLGNLRQQLLEDGQRGGTTDESPDS